jgi:glycerophosphoryl diester phosphodiesterase
MTHRAKLIVPGLLLFFSLHSYGQVNLLIKQLHQPADKQVMVAAHRGDWRNAPENSLQAYKLAIEEGVDIIEVDLNKTSDGVIVIMHDETINRTTDGKGRPGDYTLEELKKFHLRNGLGVVTRHTVPTLEEVLQLAKGKVMVNLDKSYPYFNEAYGIAKKLGVLNQTIFKAQVHCEEVKQKYAAIIDSIIFMPVVTLDHVDALQSIRQYQQVMKPVAFEFIFQRDTSAILGKAAVINKNGAKIWINSLWPSLNGTHDDDMAVELGNKRDSWGWLIEHGATIIQTDRPKELLEYLRKNNYHK